MRDELQRSVKNRGHMQDPIKELVKEKWQKLLSIFSNPTKEDVEDQR